MRVEFCQYPVPLWCLQHQGGIFFVTVVDGYVSLRNKTVVRAKVRLYLVYQRCNIPRDTRKSQAQSVLSGVCITCII